MRTDRTSGRLRSSLLLLASLSLLTVATEAVARPGLGGHGGGNIGGHHAGGGIHARPGGHPTHISGGSHPRPHPPAPHPRPHPSPHPHPHPEPHPHPHPGPGPHPHPGPHPGPGPHPPRPYPHPIPWVPGAVVWGTVIADEMWDDVVDYVVYALPSDCREVKVNGVKYAECNNGKWFEMVYHGSQIAYIEVPDPR